MEIDIRFLRLLEEICIEKRKESTRDRFAWEFYNGEINMLQLIIEQYDKIVPLKTKETTV